MSHRKLHAYLYHVKVENQINQSHLMKIKDLLLLRLVFLLYMTIVIIQTQIQNDFMQNFLYLTLWGAYISYGYFIFAVIENISYLLNAKNQFFHDALWQLTHILFNIALCFEVPVFLLFWGYIYPQVTFKDTSQLIFNINLHGGFFLCVFIDWIVNDIKLEKRHLYVVLFLAGLYSIVNFTYVIISGIEIYPGINWANPISYITTVMASILMIATFWVGHITYEKFKKHKIERNYLLSDSQTQESLESLKFSGN